MTADKTSSDFVMDRTATRLLRKGEAEDIPICQGSIAERIGMVWPLTVEIASTFGVFNVEQRLQRDVTLLIRGKG